MSAAAWWERLQRLRQVVGVYKVATLPFALVATGATGARLYNYWNPAGYARWYLWSISAGQFQEPFYKGPWVDNKSMTELVQAALKHHPDEERMTLISGLQFSGKTITVLKECHEQKKVGFFVDLGDYKGNADDKKGIEEFVVSSLISNQTMVDHSWFQKLKWSFFPKPEPACVWEGLRGAFKTHSQQLALVVDETQVLANKAMQHSGILNEFCAISQHGVVVLVAAEFAVAQFFKVMTHIYSRTTMVYAKAATAEEMRPHVKDRFAKDFGAEGVEDIVNSFDGSFRLLRCLDENRSHGIAGVRKWHKQQLYLELTQELTQNGMKKDEKAGSSGGAMLAAAKMVFALPVKAIDKGTLELAQAGAAKVETSGGELIASWASPLTGEVMKELVCDATIHAIMEARVPKDLYGRFQQVIGGRCPAAQK